MGVSQLTGISLPPTAQVQIVKKQRHLASTSEPGASGKSFPMTLIILRQGN